MSIETIVKQMARQMPHLNHRLFVAILFDKVGPLEESTVSRAWAYYLLAEGEK